MSEKDNKSNSTLPPPGHWRQSSYKQATDRDFEEGVNFDRGQTRPRSKLTESGDFEGVLERALETGINRTNSGQNFEDSVESCGDNSTLAATGSYNLDDIDEGLVGEGTTAGDDDLEGTLENSPAFPASAVEDYEMAHPVNLSVVMEQDSASLSSQEQNLAEEKGTDFNSKKESHVHFESAIEESGAYDDTVSVPPLGVSKVQEMTKIFSETPNIPMPQTPVIYSTGLLSSENKITAEEKEVPEATSSEQMIEETSSGTTAVTTAVSPPPLLPRDEITPVAKKLTNGQYNHYVNDAIYDDIPEDVSPAQERSKVKEELYEDVPEEQNEDAACPQSQKTEQTNQDTDNKASANHDQDNKVDVQSKMPYDDVPVESLPVSDQTVVNSRPQKPDALDVISSYDVLWRAAKKKNKKPALGHYGYLISPTPGGEDENIAKDAGDLQGEGKGEGQADIGQGQVKKEEPAYFVYDDHAGTASNMAEDSDSNPDDIYEPVEGADQPDDDDDDDDGWGSEEFEEYSDFEGEEIPSPGSVTLPRGLDPNKVYENVIQMSSTSVRKVRAKSAHELPTQEAPSFMSNLRRIGSFRNKQDKKTDNEEPQIIDVYLSSKKHPPPQLPPEPDNLTAEQKKRRHILASLIDSENSYVVSLKRLVEDYEKPLRLDPNILSMDRVRVIFHRVSDILQCHLMFQIELEACVTDWDKEESIGNVFTASFSKDLVFDAYSAYVNNFSKAMDTAKMAAKQKASFGDFLKEKINKAPDRLSLFGLMVKPVQRFPQFIMLLQDLLKHTPTGHKDRMALQRALTELENLTHKLNECKRQAEQKREAKEIISNLNVSVMKKGVNEGNRALVRQDDMTQIAAQKEYNVHGTINKSKMRRLLILNDLLMCTSIERKESESGSLIEKHRLKWYVPINEVELVDTAITPNMQVTVKSEPGRTTISSLKQGTVKDYSSEGAMQLRRELDNMLHDFAVVGQVTNLISSLRYQYELLSEETMDSLKRELLRKIQAKDEQLRMYDSYTIQITFPEKTGRVKYTYQVRSPEEKQSWELDFKMTQLAMDPNNNPAWTFPEHVEREKGLLKMPLFIRALPIDITKQYTKVDCAVPVFLQSSDNSGLGIQHLWACSSNEDRGQVTIISLHTSKPRVIESFMACEAKIVCVEFVPGPNLFQGEDASDTVCAGDTVWMGTDSNRIGVYSVREQERKDAIFTIDIPNPIRTMKYMKDKVFVAMENGAIIIFSRGKDDEWKINESHTSKLGEQPVLCLLEVEDKMWCACGNKINIINPKTELKEKTLTVEKSGCIQCMVQSGCGFWISFKEESLIRLYHVETFQHLQDINIASAVTRALKHKARKPGTDFSRGIAITCLMASRGILWIGTNKGITLSLPLPRLEGVPLISRGPSVSCHTHIGPVKFLVGICPEVIIDPVPGRAESFQGDANGENVDVKDTDRLELPCSAGDASATSPLSSPSPKATSPKCPPESASGSGSQTMPAVVSPKSKRKSKGDIRRISLSHVSEKTERTSDREVIRSYSIEHSFKPLKANAKSKWKSTPIGLDAIDKVEYDDDISVLYGSLLKGTGTEDYEDVLVQTSGEHGYMTLQATGADLLRYRKTKTASIMFPKRRVKSMASPAVGETAHTFSFDSAVKLRSYNRTSSELTSSFESVDETEEDIATPASDDVDEGDVTKSSDRKLHNLHCKSVIVVSGGDGYLNWNIATPRDKKQEDARLILWQCKVA